MNATVSVEGRERREISGEEARGTILVRGRNYIPSFEGSQAVAARHSGRGNAYDRN
jgi:hypothetical protein